MKRLLLLLPLAACAALAGCAEYGPAAYGTAYGSYPAYPAYPAYSTSAYAYGPAYGYYPAGVYGGPSVVLGNAYGYGYGDGDRRYRDHARDHDRRDREHHDDREGHRAGRHDRAARAPSFGPDRNGVWHLGGGPGTAERTEPPPARTAEPPRFGPDRTGTWHLGG